MALHRQNAELDYEIASVLSEHASGGESQRVTAARPGLTSDRRAQGRHWT